MFVKTLAQTKMWGLWQYMFDLCNESAGDHLAGHLFPTPISQLSRHLRLLPDLPHGTQLHKASLSSSLATTL